jgi:hypothetical protein
VGTYICAYRRRVGTATAFLPESLIHEDALNTR